MDQKSLINYHREAFLHPLHLAVLSALVLITVALAVFSSVLGFGVSSVLGFGLLTAAAESLYLALAPTSPVMVRHINAQKGVEVEEVERELHNAHLYARLQDESRARYNVFLSKKNQLFERLEDMVGYRQMGVGQMKTKLNKLETSFLQLLSDLDNQQSLEDLQDNSKLQRERSRLVLDLQEASSPRVRQMLDRRIALLDKRLGMTDQSQERRQLAKIQLDTIADTLDYIFSQTINIEAVPDLNATLDQVIQDSEVRHQTLRELEDVFSMEPHYNLEHDSSYGAAESSSSSASQRI